MKRQTKNITRNVQWLRALGASNEQLELNKLFSDSTIGLSIDKHVILEQNLDICAELAANLLARIFDKFTIRIDGAVNEEIEDEKCRRYISKVKSQINNINPDSRFISSSDAKCWLCIGQHCTDLKSNPLFIDASSWMAFFSRTKTIQLGEKRIFNPLSACVAACLGATEVFKTIFWHNLPNCELSTNYYLNLLDYSVNGTISQDPFPDRIIIKEDAYLIGAGAIGNALVYSLSKLPDLRGTFHIVENRNRLRKDHLQRYILTTSSNINLGKIELTRLALSRFSDLIVRSHKVDFNQYAIKEKPDFMFDLVISAVDSSEARRDIQAKLPKLILNGWTGGPEFGVSKHDFSEESPCLMCLYLNSGQMNIDKTIGDYLGIDWFRVAEMRTKNIPLPTSDLKHIGKRFNLTEPELKEFRDYSVEAMYRELACARNMLVIGGHEFVVPIAFLSALAGTFLAVELCKLSSNEISAKASDDYYVRMNSFVPPVVIARGRPKEPKCICGDADYKSAYIEKFAP